MVGGRFWVTLVAMFVAGSLVASVVDAAPPPLTATQYRAQATTLCRATERGFASVKPPKLVSVSPSALPAHPSSLSTVTSALFNALAKASSPRVLDPKLVVVLNVMVEYLGRNYRALTDLRPPPGLTGASARVLRDEKADLAFFGSLLDSARMDKLTFTGFVLSFLMQGKKTGAEEGALWKQIGAPACSLWRKR